MSKIIAVNAGSSSLKYQVYETPEFEVLASGQIERIGKEDAIVSISAKGEKHKRVVSILDHQEAVAIVLKDILEYSELDSLDEIVGVGHRIVHGGEIFEESVLTSDEVVEQVKKLSKLAPLHNPANLTGYHAFKKALKQAKHVFVFDTAFHQTMKPQVYMYPLPYEYYEKYSVRKYGFHGTSHKFVSKRLAQLLDKTPEQVNVIVCHLGNGASISAVKAGKVIDTSMGFTPLSGVMMGTRTGDVDPAVFPYLLEETGKSSDELTDVYNKESGMLGTSGISNDAREIEDATNAKIPRAVLTSDMYAYRIANFIGSYLIHLGHVDAIAFTAGIGEYDSGVRKRVMENISEALQIEPDYKLNSEVRGIEVELSKPGSKTRVFIVPTDEELVIAQDTQRILGL